MGIFLVLTVPILAFWALDQMVFQARRLNAGQAADSGLGQFTDKLPWAAAAATFLAVRFDGFQIGDLPLIVGLSSIAVLLFEYLFAKRFRSKLNGPQLRSPIVVEAAWLLGPILLICVVLYRLFGDFFDFEAVLLLLIIYTGVIFAGVKLWKLGQYEDGTEHLVADYGRTFFPVVIVVLVLRSFAFEPFRIPSGSMLPTLNVGDFILVKKYSYGVKMPVLYNTLIEVGQPERGDVAVFRYPPNPSQDYIKRIVGLPGDVIRYEDKVLYVNGEPAVQEFIAPYNGDGRERSAHVYFEALFGVDHNILINTRSPSVSGEVVVPEGHYFAMGDNRDNSRDSRAWGFVPEQNLAGKAVLIWMNWDGNLGRPDWSRIGTVIE